MIAKVFRFHGHGSLRFLYTKGKTVRTNFVSMKFVQNKRRQSNRLAVVVAKKVSKKAPVRNRIRRRIYEAMRSYWPMVDTPYDIAITVFDERVAEIPANELNECIKDLLEKANIYKQ